MNARDGIADMLKSFEERLLERGYVADAAQRAAAERLQRLFEELMAFKRARANPLKKLLSRPQPPRGVYLWGGVGRGKSFLMDCFFAALPYRCKRRVHFHAFMQSVHERLKVHKALPDPLMRVADDVARQVRLLCFDEFHVSDIADAMILGRVIAALVDAGVVIVATSNYPPDGLYPNGLQRQNFLPTIELLKRHLDVIEVDAGTDYRLRSLEKIDVYLVPADREAEDQLARDFEALAGDTGQPGRVTLLGRELKARRLASGVAWFDFAELCEGPRSQNDYLELARGFHTVLLSGVPRMPREAADAARRFTWLVDIFYDHKVKLILSAACAAHELYVAGPHAQEFPRTVSRLVEMRTRDYLALGHRPEAMVST